MRNKSKYRLTLAVAFVLACGLIAQGVLLWQTRQQVAALDPVASQTVQDENLSPIEQRLLSKLDKQDQQNAQQLAADPFFGPAFSDPFSDPFAEFERMQQRMNALMSGSFPGSSLGNGSMMSFSSAGPEIDLQETDDDYRVVIKVPEEQEIALNTEVEDNEITVSGKITAQKDQTGNGFSGQFISSSQFSRRFDLPGDVDDLKMRTEQNDDGLVIILPKKEEDRDHSGVS